MSPSAAECSELEDDLSTEAELRDCAIALADGFTVASLEVNGRSVDVSGHRITTPLFTFTAPADNIFQEDPVNTPMVGSMWLVMIRPLPPGEHTLVLRSELPEFEFRADITYHLTILPETSVSDAAVEPSAGAEMGWLFAAVLATIAAGVLVRRNRARYAA